MPSLLLALALALTAAARAGQGPHQGSLPGGPPGAEGQQAPMPPASMMTGANSRADADASSDGPQPQDQREPGDQDAREGDGAPAPMPGMAAPMGAAARDDNGSKEDAPPFGLADARANIASVIETFVARRTVDGAWLLRDKRTGKARRLQLDGVDEKKTESAGGQRYAAPAYLKDLDSSERLRARFEADFTGPEWKIVSLRLFEAAPAKPKKKR